MTIIARKQPIHNLFYQPHLSLSFPEFERLIYSLVGREKTEKILQLLKMGIKPVTPGWKALG